MKQLSLLIALWVFLLCCLFSPSVKSQTSSKVAIPKWKTLNELSQSLISPHFQLKEAVRVSSPKIKKISSIAVLGISSNVLTAIICSDDSKWLKVEIEIDTAAKIKRFEILQEGYLVDGSNKHIGGVEGTAIYDGYFYVSLDNDVKGEQKNYIYKYNLDKIGKKWKFEEEIELVDKASFPTESAYKNAGLEALTITDDGNLFTIYEKGNGNKRSAWLKNLHRKKQAVATFKYIAQGTEIKGATTLSNGNIIIIEKDFETIGTRFSIHELDRKVLNRSDYLTSKKLLESEFSKNYFDNFEGITSFIMYEKEYLLIISDDNAKSDQNTLLFLFEPIDQKEKQSNARRQAKDETGAENTKKRKVIDPTLIPYPEFSKNANAQGDHISGNNRQLIYDTRAGARLTSIDGKRVHGIPRHANISVAISPFTLRGIVQDEVKYFTVSIEGKDHLFKNSVQNLYESALPLSSSKDTSGEKSSNSNDQQLATSAEDALDLLKKGASKAELKKVLEKIEANLPEDEKAPFAQLKKTFMTKDKDRSAKANLENALNKIKEECAARHSVPKAESRLGTYLNNVLEGWNKGDQYVQYSEIQQLKDYRDTLKKAILEWQLSGEKLSLDERNVLNKVLHWLPSEIYLTTFSSIAPDKDEIEIKLKTFGEEGAAINEFKLAKKRISTGLAINLGTSLFFTGLKSNNAYLNDSFPTSDTTIERRVIMPTNNQFSIGIGANAELSFRTPSIVRPMISFGFFVPFNEDVKPLVALGAGLTIGTQKVKFSASFGAAFGAVNAIKEEYLDKNVSATIQLSEVTETVWNHSWQLAIGISYNIAGTN